MSHFFSTEAWTKKNFYMESLLFHCLEAETFPAPSQGQGVSFEDGPRALGPRGPAGSPRSSAWNVGPFWASRVVGQPGGGREGRWVGLRHAVTTPDVLTSQVLGTLTSDMAVHARLISPKGQLSEVPALLSRESGAMSPALGQGWTVVG